MVERSLLITLVYLVLFVLLMGFMKILSLTRNSWPEGWVSFLLFAPMPSYRTWKRGTAPDEHELMRSAGFLVLELVVLVGFYALPPDIVVSEYHWIIQGYLAIVPFVLLIDALGRLVRFEYGLIGVGIPHIHENFLSSTSLTEFWSQWNVWFADFLEETCFKPFVRYPVLGLFVAFGASGIFHEYLVNLPLFWIYEVKFFGTMMLYFLLQALGVWFERSWLMKRSASNRVWTWLVVVGPVPLVLNLGTLRIFHLGFFG